MFIIMMIAYHIYHHILCGDLLLITYHIYHHVYQHSIMLLRLVLHHHGDHLAKWAGSNIATWQPAGWVVETHP